MSRDCTKVCGGSSTEDSLNGEGREGENIWLGSNCNISGGHLLEKKEKKKKKEMKRMKREG